MAKILEVSRDNDGDLNPQAAVKHVSDPLKDGSNSSPPELFRHSSMEKIRHRCQNFNLFPYLLYSFDNSKSHPLARKVNICINHLLTGIIERIFFVYKSSRLAVLRGISTVKHQQFVKAKKPSKVSEADKAPKTSEASDTKPLPEVLKPSAKFHSVVSRPKRKETPFLLVIAIYLAPLILCFQLLGLSSLMVFGKYNPGFIFLFTSLLFLGCIAITVFTHETVKRCPVKCQKQKVQ